MSSSSLRKVLVYATGPLEDRLAGPEIRALQFAHALSSEYEVTLMAHRGDRVERDGFPVVPSARHLLLREAVRNDVIISPCLPPYLLMSKGMFGLAAISDRYDPHELELVALENECHDRELHRRSLALAVDLRSADVVLCASEQQRQNLVATARSMKRSGPMASLDPFVVPFGIAEPPPPSGGRPLRKQFSQIQDTDKVVLWWGAVWKWLDAETPIRAFATMARSRPDVKLVITAGSPPNANNKRFEAVAEARELARQLGVLDRTVLFVDEWIPYEERWEYLREADIGVTLHRFSAEAELSARSRYIDYLAAALPCVLGRGDQTAAEFEASGFATLVDHRDPVALADTVLKLADDRTRLDAAEEAARRLASERRLSTVAGKLREAVELASAKRQFRPRRGTFATAGAAGSYYTCKLADHLRG